MRPNLKHSWVMLHARQNAEGSTQKAEDRNRWLHRYVSSSPASCLLLTAFCLLLTGGCESLQRKLTRKPKVPPPRPTPVIRFEDYSKAMTPMDRYRKHYLLFDYWNQELTDALMSQPMNPKRLTRASNESLVELRSLQNLLAPETAERLVPVIEQREVMNRRLQSSSFSTVEANPVVRSLDSQTRQIRREFFWRNVQDRLKSATTESRPEPQEPEPVHPTGG